MLKTPDSGQIIATDRVVALDRARTFITLLVVLYHAAINYTHFGIGGDRMRWLGFDLVVLFCDSFFMACMFFISGLFVHDSISRRGASNYLASRAFRLGVPFLISVFVLMPIAYYRYYHLEFDVFHYYAHMVTVGTVVGGIGLVPLGAAGLRRVRRGDLCRRAARDCCARAAGRWHQ